MSAEKINWQPIPDYGDHMTLSDFIRSCTSGSFIDYDGYGYYATSDRMSDKVVVPSDVTCNKVDRSYTHVVWFNR